MRLGWAAGLGEGRQGPLAPMACSADALENDGIALWQAWANCVETEVSNGVVDPKHLRPVVKVWVFQ
ncbi:hypothetical protein X727_31160 [Mesorhizobium sp. L103C119B0]|nr:hypothetical protein X727_31160 [Mesorhizobium sp. L103C119B0]